MAAEIPLTRGLVAIVDDQDAAGILQYRWQAVPTRTGRFYASRYNNVAGEPVTVKMHRQIVPCAPGLMIDHINGNGLDNRRQNLRAVSARQNSLNRGVRRDAETGYKGVRPYRGRYRAYLHLAKKPLILGSFKSAPEAAAMYDAAAFVFYGAFARFNFPDQLPSDDLRQQVVARFGNHLSLNDHLLRHARSSAVQQNEGDPDP